MSEPSIAPYVYNLTDLIGKRSDDRRTMIVASFEVRRFHAIVALIGSAIALPISLIAAAFIGTYAILVFLAVQLVVFRLASNTQEGLRVKQWQSLYDKGTFKQGQFFMCGVPIDPTAVEIINIRSSSVPVEHLALEENDHPQRAMRR